MTRQNVQIVLVAVVLIGAAGMAAAQTEEVVHVIAMEPGGRFTLGNISGEITVTGVDGDHLTIRATKRVAGRGSGAADALDRVEIDIEERGNRVIVETDAIRGIAAAGGARLRLSTVSGDMAIGIRASTVLQPAASRPSGIH